jgi:hypothetical protein
VHSSTSNSDLPCLDCSWIKMWAMALVLSGGILGGLEAWYRHHGHRPTIRDDASLWAYHRDQVYGDAYTRPVVCLGDCRMQLGFMPALLENRFRGYRVAQLAVYETSPMAALRDLANDRRFHGVVLCGVTEREFCDDVWETQQDYVDFYRRQYNLNVMLNVLMGAAIEEHAVLVHPYLRLDMVLSHWIQEGSLPTPYYLETHWDRSRLADYTAVDLAVHRAWSMRRLSWLLSSGAPPEPGTWLSWALRIEPSVKAIQARGGRVVFIRFPTSGDYNVKEQAVFPRAQCWDRFAAQTSALTIHFKDFPSLADFSCPDLVHLDRRDVPRFTLELLDILDDKEVLGQNPGTLAPGSTGGWPRL